MADENIEVSRGEIHMLHVRIPRLIDLSFKSRWRKMDITIVNRMLGLYFDSYPLCRASPLNKQHP
jgi:hypothetical protein